jgi:PBP4 family serine-type D-alanyl-D-alanine carboxypeptidase
MKFGVLARGVSCCLAVLASFAGGHVLQAQSPATLEQRIQKVMERPEFAHSHFGLKFIEADTGKTVYALNSPKLFVPGSTTKLLTTGTAMELLGADYRFHTKIYRTGPIKDGTLEGDLVLVASGDLNLSNRMQPDGTMAFEDEDHSYGGPDSRGLPGDPLTAIKDFAKQVAAKGIKKIKGHVLVDISLFPEGERELGTGVVISPIVVNDNVIDVIVSPGATENAPVDLKINPQSSYVRIINQATTGKAGSRNTVEYTDKKQNPDGTRTVTLTGSMALGAKASMHSYPVPEPSRFAATVLMEALKEQGVTASLAPFGETIDFKKLAASYTPDNLVAEHVSAPFSEEVKVTLKVSQNLHASTMPYLVGALVGHKTSGILQAGFDQENEFLTKAGLDLSGAAQSDGAGGDAYFTPDFMTQYLLYMSKTKDYDAFYRGLPILGKDGTLVKIQTASPAAGHVHAKTGTYGTYDALNKKLMVTGKGLSGYMDTASGQHLILALYVNMVSVPMDDPEAMQKIAGEALGEIAAAAYDAPLAMAAQAKPTDDGYDVLIKNGMIVDGSGNPWVSGDIAIRGDRIVAIGRVEGVTAKRVIDATGLVVSPGFIDMLGQSELQLLIDNRSLSKLSQGITTEITGEGGSIAPQTDLTLASLQPTLDQYKVKVDWTTLDGYFKRLDKSGTPLNIGTYVGAGQVREAVIGEVDREPTPAELEKMKGMVAQAMQDGAFGISTALIYPPGHYAKTEELIELAKVASQYGGIYGSHMRSEGQTEPQAIDEALRIGREANLPVEIFHLKVSGATRWGNMVKVVAQIQAARDAGQDVTANMYPYIAGGTALASSLPPWVADGGMEKLLQRLHDPATRAKIKAEMAADHPNWENLFFDCGGGKGVMVAGVENPDLKKYNGKTIAEIAADQKKSELDTLFDFIIADKGQSGALYFMASEKDLVTGLKQPWTSLCLDAGELSLDGPLYEPHTHPRAFGAMPRFLGHYVRDEHLLPLEQGIRKMTSLPAQREHLAGRGLLRQGYFADITIFDPATIIDKATYQQPTQLSQGVKYVFVNGQLEFADGKLTGVTAGRPLRGPGYKQQPAAGSN